MGAIAEHVVAKLVGIEGRSGDWVPHVYAKGAIGPREVLPWSRDHVEFILDAIIEETGALPPTLAVCAVKDFTANAEIDAKLRHRSIGGRTPERRGLD